jgi:hypothetical protein
MSVTRNLIRVARRSKQTEFDSTDQLEDDEGLAFATAVPGAPLQVVGRLADDGRWYIACLAIAPSNEAAANPRDDIPAGMIVLENEPVAEALIRYSLREALATPGEPRDMIVERLAMPGAERFRSAMH